MDKFHCLHRLKEELGITDIRFQFNSTKLGLSQKKSRKFRDFFMTISSLF